MVQVVILCVMVWNLTGYETILNHVMWRGCGVTRRSLIDDTRLWCVVQVVARQRVQGGVEGPDRLPGPLLHHLLRLPLRPVGGGAQGVGREERRAVLRYVVLTITLTLATISPEVLAVYPSFEVMVKKGFLTEEEARLLDKHKEESEQQVAWVPIVWACQIVQRARQAGRIATNLGQKALTDEMLNLRVSCGRLLGFNSHNIPLVYVQVVTLAVYSFFLISVIGGQFIDTTKGYETHTIDLYVPFFAILQLVFYLGWLKVAEALINPFGDDDHDFEFLSMIERHRKMVEMLGDSAANDLPFLDPLSKEDADSSAPTMHTSVPIVAPTVCPVICKMIETQPASAGGRIVQETTPLITTSKAEPPLLPNIRHISPYS
ncbi:bestrophin-2-like isoform X4 [Eriocheir sinensis]|uniref:bestrophin-2-like isoform X4 n=1 Tax=Eriocheir sinensis TaxID=95602 RepID=UPI0021C65107|nr:bestrophin-2-like isoform X4 [Eriocheir sinensis]